MLQMQKDLSKSFYVLLSLPATAMGFALSIQISALSWILTTQYGLDIHQVGLVWAAGPIAGILGQVIVGIISDNVWFWNGRRRPFMLIGGVLSAMMLLALPNIDVISVSLGFEGLMGVAIAIALTLDLSINISFNPTRSIIADVTPEGEARTKGYTWMQTVSGSFGVLAYAVGAYWGNYALIYLGVILVFFLSILSPMFIEEPRTLNSEEISTESEHVSLRLIMSNIKPLWGFIIYDIYAISIQMLGIKTEHFWAEIIALSVTIILIFITVIKKESPSNNGTNEVGFNKILAANSFSWIGVQTMFVFIFAFLQDKMPNLSDDELGKVIATSFLTLSIVAAFFPALVLEPLSKKLGRVKVHTVSIASMVIGYWFVAVYGSQKELLFAAMAFIGIGWSAIISLPFAIMSEKVNSARMGLYMGLFNLSIVIPQLVVSLGVGLVISKVADKSIVFYISTVALAISAIAWSMVSEGKPTKNPT